MIPYDDAVKEGLQMVARLDDDTNWKLGELVDRIEQGYGAQSLAKFAEEVGEISVAELKRYRDVYRAFPTEASRYGHSWDVCCILAKHPYRDGILKSRAQP
jgi:hypothetical protein